MSLLLAVIHFLTWVQSLPYPPHDYENAEEMIVDAIVSLLSSKLPDDDEIAQIFARFLLLRIGLVAGSLVAYDIPAMKDLGGDSVAIISKYQEALALMAKEKPKVWNSSFCLSDSFLKATLAHY